jgi:protein-tyrosine phosphatase
MTVVVKVLFVCLGNMCRSPMSQGVFEKLVENAGLSNLIDADSAGTHAHHVGKPPDTRAQAAASQRGYELSGQRVRRACASDFEEFDYVIAMDFFNFEHLYDMCPPGHDHKIKLFMDFAKDCIEEEVPDPYYGAQSGFERVLDLVEDAAKGLLGEIRQRHRI